VKNPVVDVVYQQEFDENVLPSFEINTHSEADTAILGMYGEARTSEMQHLNEFNAQEWPLPFDDQNSTSHINLRPLPPSFRETKSLVELNGELLVRSVTWNQQAQRLPTASDLVKHLIPMRMYHIVAIGTQECENTISKSIFNPYKEKWESLCQEVMGGEYLLLRGHALQASHLVVFVHQGIRQLISNVQSHAVPTGICDTLGNKGGIGISFNVGRSSFCFLTAHLAAHQHEMDRRTKEFARISSEISSALGKNEKYSLLQEKNSLLVDEIIPPLVLEERFQDDGSNGSSSSADINANNCTPQNNNCCSSRTHSSSVNPLALSFDFVFWGGDLNYRIHGTRRIVDILLQSNNHAALVSNDQLSMMMQFDKTFNGLHEGQLTFRPTYKFDKGTDVYDTSQKQRIPSWTDRILYKSHGKVELLSYFSANEIRNSDHKPVYATFRCSINVENGGDENDEHLWKSETKSEVCVIS